MSPRKTRRHSTANRTAQPSGSPLPEPPKTGPSGRKSEAKGKSANAARKSSPQGSASTATETSTSSQLPVMELPPEDAIYTATLTIRALEEIIERTRALELATTANSTKLDDLARVLGHINADLDRIVHLERESLVLHRQAARFMTLMTGIFEGVHADRQQADP
ncbi:unnamed protein product [Caenorhabditis nigoni]|uniref:Uncharacterized protein n=1 Tax=Caenorhabditis nigoni TaxID=1611254 RepID=A0A2G5SCG9_9PELO|nr:hypothetical protein B9Z55_028235 [Caenorhabditis nigoni]